MMKTKPGVSGKRTLNMPRARQDALVAAASSATGTISAVMDQLPAKSSDGGITVKEENILEGIAHGAEGYGSEYGSGPSVANAEARKEPSPAVAGDSASPAASALTTRRSAPVPTATTQRNGPGRSFK